MSMIPVLIDNGILAQLDATAKACSSSREAALEEAILNYIEYDRYVRSKVEKGLQDIEEGRFHGCEEVDRRAEARIARYLQKQGNASE